MHDLVKSSFLLFFTLLFYSCDGPISPYKMELQDNEIACLINQELFTGELVFATLKKFDGYYQLEIDAFKNNNSIHCSIISDDDKFVGSYYFDKKTFNGVSYSTNSLKYLKEQEEGNKLYSSQYCEAPIGQVEITNFNLQDKVCSGFIHAKLCNKNTETYDLEELSVSECRFYNITFQLVSN